MLALGLLIDHRYRVEQLLGRGGMAEVYRAVDTEAGQPVAVKLLRDVDAGDLRRFRIEVAALARLDHPGVIKLYETGSHEGVPYLVLELVDGPTLAHELVDGPLGLDRSIGLASHLADAVAHAHGLTVVHRDLKPANVLFDAARRARLTDFGIAHLADVSGVTAAGMVLGTVPYLAPEQVEGRPVGAPADIYALGLVVLECLTGARCYPGGRLEAAIARLHRPPPIPGSLPSWLRDVLAAMTARDPGRRPRADAVTEAFDTRSAEPVLGSTIAFATPITATTAPTPTEPLTHCGTSARRSAPAGAPGRQRPLAAGRRSRLAAVAAASVALALPAWLSASSDPQSADAPAAPEPASAGPSPAPTSTTVAPLSSTPPPPNPVEQEEDDGQTGAPDQADQGDDDHGGKGKEAKGKGDDEDGGDNGNSGHGG